MIFIDLLIGVFVGLGVSIFFILKSSFFNVYQFKEIINEEYGEMIYYIVLVEDVLFFNKLSILKKFNLIFGNLKVVLDFFNIKFIVFDVKEMIKDYIDQV